MSSKIVASALAAFIVLEAGAARAQTTSSDAAIAQSLFDEGRKLMNAKRYDEACPRLERSYKLDPAAGTLLNLAVCHEKIGKTATAWDEFRDSITMARRENRADRVRFAQKHVDALKDRICTLTVRHDGHEGGLSLRLDGIKLGAESLGLALPIDPGVHTIEAEAPEHESWKSSVELRRDGQQETLDIPALKELPKETHAPLPTVTVVATPPPKSHGGVSPWIALPITAGVLGFGALALGGIEALSSWHDRTAACGIGGDANACTSAGLAADADARRWALVADIGLGVGVAGAIATIVVAAVGRGSSKEAHVAVSPFVTPQSAGFALGAIF